MMSSNTSALLGAAVVGAGAATAAGLNARSIKQMAGKVAESVGLNNSVGHATCSTVCHCDKYKRIFRSHCTRAPEAGPVKTVKVLILKQLCS